MKAKLISEYSRNWSRSMSQSDIDRENDTFGEYLNKKPYWEAVAKAMGGTLGDFEAEPGWRLIRIMHPEIGGIDIDHEWRDDGTATKPVTKIDTRSVGENVGRFAIWDNPEDYAEDVMKAIQKMEDYYNDDDDDGYHPEYGYPDKPVTEAINPSFERAKEIYARTKENQEQKIVEPGIYTDVLYSDGGPNDRGRPQVTVKVTEPMSKYDIALELAQKLGYTNPWGYLSLEDLRKTDEEVDLIVPDKQMSMFGESLNEGFATEEGRNLDSIARLLRYDDLHEMLGDNPGLFEACIEWIDRTFGEQLAKEDIDPTELERLGLYDAAEEARKFQEGGEYF